MTIRCPKCGEHCEIDIEPVVGQHVICPFCHVKFSYGEAQEGTEPVEVGATSARTIMAVCPYCGFGEPVDCECAGQVGVCSKCQGEFTIVPDAQGIPVRVQNSVSQLSHGKRVKNLTSVLSRLDPNLLARVIMGCGIVLGSISIVFAWFGALLFGIYLWVIGAVALKVGATSDIKHFARYLSVCLALAAMAGGGCYGMRQNEIREDRRIAAAKQERVDPCVQKIAMHYFGHELCEWCPKDSDQSKIVMHGANPFAHLQGGEGVEKSFVASSWHGSCLFMLRANLHLKPKLPTFITDEFAREKVIQFKDSPLIAKITKMLGKAPRLFQNRPLAGELVNLNAAFDSVERTEKGEPLVSIKVSYSLSSGSLLARQAGRDSDAGCSDHESWNFEICYTGR